MQRVPKLVVVLFSALALVVSSFIFLDSIPSKEEVWIDSQNDRIVITDISSDGLIWWNTSVQ